MISIIIPTLNEAAMLPESVARIRNDKTTHEIVVVDAMSTDATIPIAEAAKCVVVRCAERHRATQMNLGATHARGEILFFLHADTLVAGETLGRIEDALVNPRIVGGGFTRRFSGGGTMLHLSCALADVRSRWLRWFFGDQGIFVRRTVFEQVGGFGRLPMFEDLDLCRRLKRAGKLVCLGPPVLSSARRFTARGALLTLMRDAWLTVRYLSGTNPERLAGSSEGGIKKRH